MSATLTTTGPSDELRQRARNRLKRHLVAFIVGMVVLTPVWALTQWQTSGGFERWNKDHSHPGDWEPWIVNVALVWALIIAIIALKTHFDHPASRNEVRDDA